MSLGLKHAELCWIGLSVDVRVWVWNLVCCTEGRTQTEGGAVGGGERTPSICATGGQIETLVVAQLLELTGLLVSRCSSPCLHDFPNTEFLKLWSADQKWSSGSALVVLLD